MSLTINNNMMAYTSARYLSSSYNKLSDSTRKLSSGLRVDTAADDAAGLAIRELMRSDIAALNQGVRNANDGISLIQTADGALSVIDEKLIRMKELAEQLGEYISAPIYKTYIRSAVVVEEAQANSQDIFDYANKSTVAEDYKAFIDEFLKGVNE